MTKLYVLAGPDRDQSFEIKGESIFVGRSSDNDVAMSDVAVSRRHLKIVTRGGRQFVKDLESENGTYVGGEKITPGAEIEIKDGVPIVIGMSVICLGGHCLEYVTPFLDAIGLCNDIREESGVFRQHNTMTTQKIVELVYRVSDILIQRLDIPVMLSQVLGCIFDFLIAIDRGFIILMDSKTGGFAEVISRFREPRDDLPAAFNRDVVDRVIREGSGIIFPDPDAEDPADLKDTLRLSEIRSVMCVPIMSGSQTRGAIYVDSLKEPYGFRREDLSLFMDLGRRAGVGIENARLYLET